MDEVKKYNIYRFKQVMGPNTSPCGTTFSV